MGSLGVNLIRAAIKLLESLILASVYLRKLLAINAPVIDIQHFEDSENIIRFAI